MKIEEMVSAYIESNNLLAPGERVIVGVSGGADSLCLLDLLITLGFNPIVAHLDHMLRPESAADAEYVAQVAMEKSVQFVLEEQDPRPLVKEGHTLEEAGRLVRYRLFVRIANEYGVNAVAVGHTLDDQAETILMHLLRGAGPTGLRGMLPKTALDEWSDIRESKGIRIIRPLLATGREQTEKYCDSKGYSPITDLTNSDTTFTRNRIRHELMPLLEKFNPGIRQALSRTSDIMTRLSNLTKANLEQVQNGLVIEQGDVYELFNIDAFRNLHDALQWEFVYKAVMRVSPGSQDVDYDSVLRAVDILCDDQRTRANLVSGIEVFRFLGLGLICRSNVRVPFQRWPQLDLPQAIHVSISGQVILNKYWSLTSIHKKLSGTDLETIFNNEDPNVAFLDAAGLTDDLHVRPFMHGDRFQPLGMDGTMKVSDYFTNVKIPSLARKYWPLLIAGEEIVWIIGLRPSNRARVQENTKEIVEFRLQKKRIDNETKVQPMD